MVITIQRKTDNKYLQSVETDTWVDNLNDAYEMNIIEMETVKAALLSSYAEDDIREVPNFFKMKPITREERKAIRNLIKK